MAMKMLGEMGTGGTCSAPTDETRSQLSFKDFNSDSPFTVGQFPLKSAIITDFSGRLRLANRLIETKGFSY